MDYYGSSLNNSYLAVHTDALCANIAAIEKTLSPGAEIIPVLKCDAYGLGLSLTAPALAALPGIRTFALAHVSEGLALRSLGIGKDVLILGNPLPHALPQAVRAHLTLTAGRLGLLPELAKLAEAAGTDVTVQIKLDTGLHRAGVTVGEELDALLKELAAAGSRVRLLGVYSHFADTAKPALCREQVERFLRGAEQVERSGFSVPMRHICDSAGSEYYPEYHFDAVRLGRRLFMDHPTQPRGNIRECASWRSCITAVRRRAAGDKLGYGGVYTLDHDADIATVGVGYGDGLYLPLVEMHGDILVRGERRPLLACCMDQCMVDVTSMNVQVGEEVTFFGYDRAGHALLSQDVANFCGANEGCALTAALSQRVERIIEN